METKNLGRGLEQISDIFLSTSKKKEGPTPASGFSAVTIREATCASCANLIEGSFKKPKCRIFTFENEKYGVTHLDTIDLNYASYCENYEPEAAENPVEEKKATDPSEQVGDNCEIEETITVQKKIAYPDTEAARKDMRNTVLKYLEAGYGINSIELKKDMETSKPNSKQIKKEAVTLFVKEQKEQR